ncbi:hypothetical protein HJC23_013464 [Cyclotella cryptica]|uniref:Peptidase M50 domain-containing protein n=1 Tax=Cyclotella cryptica TaxID=29204 RepID=A0ABD3QBZ8_9STRA
MMTVLLKRSVAPSLIATPRTLTQRWNTLKNAHVTQSHIILTNSPTSRRGIVVLGRPGENQFCQSMKSGYSASSSTTSLRITRPFFLGSTHFAAIRIYSSSRPPPPKNRFTTVLGTIGAGGLVLWGKGKYILGALKLTKFASLGSMLLTVGAYTAFYGLPYAVGMTSLILIHESGHALTMKKLGIPFSPMVFIPFMGAAVAMRKRPKDAYEEALVAFGGPVLGSVGALAFAGAAHAMDSHLMFALADFGFMINLFNMIPLGMMDGGRICGAISPYAGLVGMGLGGTMAYQGMIHNPIFYLILLGGGYETFMRFYDPLGHSPPNYYRITNGQRAAITGGYFALVGALFAAMEWNRQYMVPPEQLQRTHATYSRRYD